MATRATHFSLDKFSGKGWRKQAKPLWSFFLFFDESPCEVGNLWKVKYVARFYLSDSLISLSLSLYSCWARTILLSPSNFVHKRCSLVLCWLLCISCHVVGVLGSMACRKLLNIAFFFFPLVDHCHCVRFISHFSIKTVGECWNGSKVFFSISCLVLGVLMSMACWRSPFSSFSFIQSMYKRFIKHKEHVKRGKIVFSLQMDLWMCGLVVGKWILRVLC